MNLKSKNISLNIQKDKTDILQYNSNVAQLKKDNKQIELKINNENNNLNTIYSIKFQNNNINIAKNVKKIDDFNILVQNIKDNTTELSSLNTKTLTNIENTDNLNDKIKEIITDIDKELTKINSMQAEITQNINDLNNIFGELLQIFKNFDLQQIKNSKTNIKSSRDAYEDILKNFKETNLIYIPLFKKIKEMYKPVLNTVNTDGDSVNNYNSVYKQLEVTDLMNEYNEYKTSDVTYTDIHLKKCIDNETVCKYAKSKLCSTIQHACNRLICENKLINNQDVFTNDRYFKDNKCYQQLIKEIPYL